MSFTKKENFRKIFVDTSKPTETPKTEETNPQQVRIEHTVTSVNQLLRRLGISVLPTPKNEKMIPDLQEEIVDREMKLDALKPIRVSEKRLVRLASVFLLLLLLVLSHVDAVEATDQATPDRATNDFDFRLNQDLLDTGNTFGMHQSQAEFLNALFDEVLKEEKLPSERVFMPEKTGLLHGEAIPLMSYDAIRALGLNTVLANQTLNNFGLNNYLEEDARQIVAHGNWVDTYLDVVRMGSHGTTLPIIDSEGNFLRFVPAMHSALITQSEFAVISQTYTEELVQQAVYTHFVMMWQENRDAFEAYGIYTLEDIVNALTNGTLRAFLEYVQHSMIKEANNGWTYFPYLIQVDDRPLSRSITTLNDQTNELLKAFNQVGNESVSYRDLLSIFSDPPAFLELNDAFYEEHGYPIWDSYGMFREGMRIVPASIDIQVEMNYVQAETVVPERASAPDLSERVGEILYVRAVTPHEVYYLWDTGDGEASRITPTLNRVVQEGRVLRVEIVDSHTARILPDNGAFMPYGTGMEDIFADLEHYVPVPDFEPISVFPETANRDKQAVVLQNETPELLLFEGSELILRVPVVLGAQGSTPNGSHFIFNTRGSRHMPGQPGVGFVNYFGGGNALHDSPWWDWSTVNTGFYGSHGCVNLPDYGWNLIQVGGREMSVAEFVYNWIYSVLPMEEGAESSQVTWDMPGFYQGDIAVRLLIISDSKSLYTFAQQGTATMSDLAEAVDSQTGIVLPVFSTQ